MRISKKQMFSDISRSWADILTQDNATSERRKMFFAKLRGELSAYHWIALINNNENLADDLEFLLKLTINIEYNHNKLINSQIKTQ